MIESGYHPYFADMIDKCQISNRIDYQYLRIIEFIIPEKFNEEKKDCKIFGTNSQREKPKLLELKALKNQWHT